MEIVSLPCIHVQKSLLWLILLKNYCDLRRLILGVTFNMLEHSSGKYLYTIRSANGVIVENLQVYGKTRSEADKKIQQMYMRCEIMSCNLIEDVRTRVPHLKMQWVRP